MLSAAVVVSYGLGTGFTAPRGGRPARHDRPLQPQGAERVARRIVALPDVARYALRLEILNVGIRFDGQRRNERRGGARTRPGRARGMRSSRAATLRDRGNQILVERAFASAWGIGVGDTVYLPGLGGERVVGLVEAPDDVGYPLAKPRFYLSRPAIDARFGADRNPQVNLAEIWLRNPRYLNEVLVQARATSFGLRNLRFETQSALRLLLDQAAGIVIDLLVALSVIALVTAGVMLAASARAEVQRRLAAIGVRRAVGSTRGGSRRCRSRLEGLLVALPFASIGVLAGVLATLSPAGRLLMLINEPPTGERARPAAGCGVAGGGR